MAVRFRWVGWFGPEDCEPPEPGKYWIEIQENLTTSGIQRHFDEPLFEEYCIIVHRTDNFDQTDDAILEKERRAQRIVDALNRLPLTEEIRENVGRALNG